MFFFRSTAPTAIYTFLHTLSLHDALPIFTSHSDVGRLDGAVSVAQRMGHGNRRQELSTHILQLTQTTSPRARFAWALPLHDRVQRLLLDSQDRKSTRLNSSHSCASRMPSSALNKNNTQPVIHTQDK